MKSVIFSCVVVCSLLISAAAGAQQPSQREVQKMLDCTMRPSHGPWVDEDLYSYGRLSFSYFYQPQQTEEDDQGDNLYFAFWNKSRTRGKFVHFWFRRKDVKNEFNLINDGWIRTTKRKLNVDDVMGGVYEYEKYTKLLPRLKRQPLHTVAMRQIHRTSAVCTYLGGGVSNSYDTPEKP
ncbi:MAG TPA: hypothetical protein VK738_04370 [Terriglobales bacterium]|jgi:hypothetical protein|nr:hypothetical protein [Terriglobales bacterium]